MNTPTRPVLRWHGGKWRLAPWIISHFPPHKVYVEPYGGAASVLLQKQPATTEVWNDLDDSVVSLFRVLREQPKELGDLLRLTPFARVEYSTLYEPTDDPLERARRFIARSFMGQSSKGALRKSGFDTRINPDGFASRIRCLRALPEELPLIAQRFGGVIIEQRPALEVLKLYDRRDVLFYVDPPYLSDREKHYNHEMTCDDHSALLEALCGLAGKVVLSGYPHPAYDRALSDWRRLELAAFTDGARPRTEVLWLNPACCKALDDEREQFEMFAGAAE
ncbi:DNA adenine methylase [Pleomorphomonas sp. JP5]|uniref:DNA adenine methylase n=1 Tax=Pleomorphomonas sp. JP5 TaxID=2942998 RepID=UPI002043395D|nr:DNA adenine methylase [Pleomorphomonas sp. JP5]MCM5556300.1 DNA adenine methylase [Pleomorphomonas sp. JP5]